LKVINVESVVFDVVHLKFRFLSEKRKRALYNALFQVAEGSFDILFILRILAMIHDKSHEIS
jgi:hypothetical protein